MVENVFISIIIPDVSFELLRVPNYYSALVFKLFTFVQSLLGIIIEKKIINIFPLSRTPVRPVVEISVVYPAEYFRSLRNDNSVYTNEQKTGNQRNPKGVENGKKFIETYGRHGS